MGTTVVLASHVHACHPSWCPSTSGCLDRVDCKSGACEQPGDHGVRVPHLTSPLLVAAPDQCRHLRGEVEEALGLILVVGQVLRALFGFVDVGDNAVLPASHFVAEGSQSGEAAAEDRSFNDDTARCTIGVRAGPCVFDYEAPRRCTHL